MGRKRTAEDYQRTAEENGWDSEAYEEEDSVQLTKDEPGEAYKQVQQQALDQWTMWVPDSADRAYLKVSLRILTRSDRTRCLTP
jgi:superfamily II DNA or RNA helicase